MKETLHQNRSRDKTSWHYIMFYANDVIRSTRRRQSKTTIILLANNFVAIIHLFEYNKYQIYTLNFLVKLLAKKISSVSFVSQYKKPIHNVGITILKRKRYEVCGY